MPHYLRRRVDGASYFFTVVTYRRRRLFDKDIARRCLREAFLYVQREWPFEQFAVVLLPDHLHAIWTMPPEDSDFSIRWANIKRTFSKRWIAEGGGDLVVSGNAARHRQRGVWQPRFWEHMIRSEQELYAYRDYVHLNPVRHGYVNDPLDWRWSSVHQHLKRGWLSSDWTSWSPIEARVE
ncbi:MAG: transposase [Phycisphaerales bacterium]|nr:transposase [Phycisphaerales bacterium]